MTLRAFTSIYQSHYFMRSLSRFCTRYASICTIYAKALALACLICAHVFGVFGVQHPVGISRIQRIICTMFERASARAHFIYISPGELHQINTHARRWRHTQPKNAHVAIVRSSRARARANTTINESRTPRASERRLRRRLRRWHRRRLPAVRCLGAAFFAACLSFGECKCLCLCLCMYIYVARARKQSNNEFKCVHI